MQLLNTLTTITAYLFIASITLPFILTLIYAATGYDIAGIRKPSAKAPVFTQETPEFYPLPDLGTELDGDAIYAEIDRVLAKPSPVVAANLSIPSATLTIPSEPSGDLSTLTIRQLKQLASKRKLPCYSSMRKAQLIAALS